MDLRDFEKKRSAPLNVPTFGELSMARHLYTYDLYEFFINSLNFYKAGPISVYSSSKARTYLLCQADLAAIPQEFF